MKKYGILNSNIAKLADDLGHMDLVCIGDLGLPVPKGVDKKIGRASCRERVSSPV